MSLQLDGTNGVLGNSGAFIAGTAVASTSGTSITFTGIPSWVKRVTVMFNGVSTNGTSQKMIQVGSGSITTTGYSCASTFLAAGSMGTANYTNGFQLYNLITAADTLSGSIVFTLFGSNTWTLVANIGNSASTIQSVISGSIGLAGALDRVVITTVNGTDTFDAGSINILYE